MRVWGHGFTLFVTLVVAWPLRRLFSEFARPVRRDWQGFAPSFLKHYKDTKKANNGQEKTRW